MDMDSYIVRFHALYTAPSNFPLNPAKAFLRPGHHLALQRENKNKTVPEWRYITRIVSGCVYIS